MGLTKTFHTASTAETEACGAALAREMTKDETLPSFIALFGDLGVGKTAFVRGFVSVISPLSTVRSPTFALVREYPAKPRSVFHFDLYRITDENDLISIGFYDYLNRNGICIAEWSENILDFLPPEHLRVKIEKDDPEKPDSRLITVTQQGDNA